MRLLLGTFIQEESFWWEARFPGGAWEGSNSKEQLGEKREKWKMKTKTRFRFWWREWLLKESRAWKPRQQATINVGSYCWDKNWGGCCYRGILWACFPRKGTTINVDIYCLKGNTVRGRFWARFSRKRTVINADIYYWSLHRVWGRY